MKILPFLQNVLQNHDQNRKTNGFVHWPDLHGAQKPQLPKGAPKPLPRQLGFCYLPTNSTKYANPSTVSSKNMVESNNYIRLYNNVIPCL